ncbi:MAG: class I SAM-dependent methyltransferase [Microcoleaceae cyanobacterium]
MNMEKYVKCNLCGSDNYTTLYKSGEAQINQIVKCNCCGLMYSNPRQQLEDCESIENYDPEWILNHLHLPDLQQRIEKERLQVKDYENTKSILNQLYPNRGQVIEVGSGFGYLLKFFQEDGWETIGVEPNVALCRYAESENHIDTVPTILEKANISSSSANLILMMHVIEHVPEPLATLQEVYRILKPGGTFVLETPCYDTFLFKLLGKRERSLSCDGHIYFFTTETLTKMVNQVGFNVWKLERVGRTLTLERLMYNIGVISKSKKILDFLVNSSRKLRLNQVSFSLNFGDMQRLYLQKAVVDSKV